MRSPSRTSERDVSPVGVGAVARADEDDEAGGAAVVERCCLAGGGSSSSSLSGFLCTTQHGRVQPLGPLRVHPSASITGWRVRRLGTPRLGRERPVGQIVYRGEYFLTKALNRMGQKCTRRRPSVPDSTPRGPPGRGECPAPMSPNSDLLRYHAARKLVISTPGYLLRRERRRALQAPRQRQAVSAAGCRTRPCPRASS